MQGQSPEGLWKDFLLPQKFQKSSCIIMAAMEKLRWLVKVIYMDSDTSPYLEKEMKNKKRKPHL